MPAAAAQTAFARTLVDEWVRGGLRDAVVAPGSRNTPLTLALAAHDGRAGPRRDRRAVGGVLRPGPGRGAGRPVLVSCTSGSAPAHLHPAVLEAFHGRVPLLVCTADRPWELHGVGAPQTVDQHGLYGRAVRWAVDLPVATWAAAPGLAGDGRPGAGRGASDRRPGPVHVNVAFAEPLLPTDGCGRARTWPAGPTAVAWTAARPPPVAAPAGAAAGAARRRRCGRTAGAGRGGLGRAARPTPPRARGAAGGPCWPTPCRGCARRRARADRQLRGAGAVARFGPAHRPDVVRAPGRTGHEQGHRAVARRPRRGDGRSWTRTAAGPIRAGRRPSGWRRSRPLGRADPAWTAAWRAADDGRHRGRGRPGRRLGRALRGTGGPRRRRRAG